MSYNNSYEKPPMTQTGEAAGYGQTGTGGTYGQSGAGTGYGDTGTGTGTYDNTGTGTYGNTGTGTYGNTGTGTYDNSGTGTFGNTGTGTGAYPDAAHTGGKENYNSSYNATAPNGGDTTGAGYGQYSDPSSQPPPNYMAAQSQRVRGTKDVNAGAIMTAIPTMVLVSIVILTAGATAVKSKLPKNFFSSATKASYYIGGL
ncbi:unnamed protein product [Umbelopsis sp. WA50703]